MWWRVAGRAFMGGVAGVVCGVLWTTTVCVVWLIVVLWLLKASSTTAGGETLANTFNQRCSGWSFIATVVAMTIAGVRASLGTEDSAVERLNYKLRVALDAAGVCALAGTVTGIMAGCFVPALPFLALKWSFGPHVLVSGFDMLGRALLGGSLGLWTGNAAGAALGALAPEAVERLHALLASRARQSKSAPQSETKRQSEGAP